MNDVMTCEEMKNWITIGGQLIDVRSTVEFSQGALDGAVNMPIDSLQYFAKEIDKTKPVLLYCRSGHRSGAAKKFLEMLGFDRVFNIGGYNQYVFCN